MKNLIWKLQKNRKGALSAKFSKPKWKKFEKSQIFSSKSGKEPNILLIKKNERNY